MARTAFLILGGIGFRIIDRNGCNIPVDLIGRVRLCILQSADSHLHGVMVAGLGLTLDHYLCITNCIANFSFIGLGILFFMRCMDGCFRIGFPCFRFRIIRERQLDFFRNLHMLDIVGIYGFVVSIDILLRLDGHGAGITGLGITFNITDRVITIAERKCPCLMLIFVADNLDIGRSVKITILGLAGCDLALDIDRRDGVRLPDVLALHVLIFRAVPELEFENMLRFGRFRMAGIPRVKARNIRIDIRDLALDVIPGLTLIRSLLYLCAKLIGARITSYRPRNSVFAVIVLYNALWLHALDPDCSMLDIRFAGDPRLILADHIDCGKLVVHSRLPLAVLILEFPRHGRSCVFQFMTRIRLVICLKVVGSGKDNVAILGFGSTHKFVGTIAVGKLEIVRAVFFGIALDLNLQIGEGVCTGIRNGCGVLNLNHSVLAACKLPAVCGGVLNNQLKLAVADEHMFFVAHFSVVFLNIRSFMNNYFPCGTVIAVHTHLRPVHRSAAAGAIGNQIVFLITAIRRVDILDCDLPDGVFQVIIVRFVHILDTDLKHAVSQHILKLPLAVALIPPEPNLAAERAVLLVREFEIVNILLNIDVLIDGDRSDPTEVVIPRHIIIDLIALARQSVGLGGMIWIGLSVTQHAGDLHRAVQTVHIGFAG